MKINADFNQRIFIDTEQLDWVASPMQGVKRRPLDRVGKEIARATSIVRYAPGSKFSAHTHTGGEEFIVLKGVFQDEHGDYPVGSYVRNPPQSSHTPGAEKGCTIFVKLWQFQMDDRQSVNVNLERVPMIQNAHIKGMKQAVLFEDDFEKVSVLDVAANTHVNLEIRGGAEILVLSGELSDQHNTLTKHSWLRLPIGENFVATASSQGAKIWMKTGHLTNVKAQIARVQNA